MKLINNHFLPFNTHILLCSTFFLGVGILSAALTWPNTYLYAIVSILCITNIIYGFSKKRVTLSFVLLIISFLVGHIRYKQQYSSYQNFFSKHQPIPCNIRGTITNITSIEQARTKKCLTLHIDQIQTNTTPWLSENIYIQIYTNNCNSYLVADMIQINNILIKKTLNESFLQYLLKEGIISTVFSPKCNSTLINRPQYSISRKIFTIKQNIFQRLHEKMPTNSFTLLSSLFLGNRSINKKNIEIIAEQFKYWGISHYLARSGLHLTIFTLIWHIVFRLLPLPFQFKQIFLFFLSFIYSVFSWTSISFLRAFYSFFLCTICNLFNMQIYFLQILTLVTLFVLFTSPIQLFFLDFQLSFSLTFGLAWINHLYQSNKT